MPDLGPQQFDLSVSDSYPANNPADSDDDLKVNVEVPVTIHWNLARTALEPKKNPDVEFEEARWSLAGPGPHQAYEEKPGGTVAKTGVLKWKLATSVLRRVEKSPDGKKYRLVFAPVVRLVSQFSPANGGSDQIEERAKNSAVSRGAWVAL